MHRIVGGVERLAEDALSYAAPAHPHGQIALAAVAGLHARQRHGRFREMLPP
jgi:hypothetical protein